MIGVLGVVLLLPSFAVPAWLGRGALWPNLPRARVEDPASLAALENGVRLERQGDLSASLEKYRTAANSKVSELRAVAGYAVDRVNAKLDKVASVYASMRTLSDWSHTLRVPVVLAAVLALLLLLTRLLTPRRGRN